MECTLRNNAEYFGKAKKLEIKEQMNITINFGRERIT